MLEPMIDLSDYHEYDEAQDDIGNFVSLVDRLYWKDV
jgi:hypothetical protein